MGTRRDSPETARWKVAAGVRATLDVCDLLAGLGLEDDDRPRLWLLAVRRWSDGEETPELAAVTKALKAWGAPYLTTRPYWPDTITSRWASALDTLRMARNNVAAHPTTADGWLRNVCDGLAYVLEKTGEPRDAARAQAESLYTARLAAKQAA